MTDLGGIAYMPGEAWSITWTPSPAVADSDTVKLIFGGLTITGTVASGGGSVAFSFTAAQTATLTAYYIYDARVTVNDTERTESYDFTTGPSVTGAATYPAVPDPLSIEAGTGITCSPDPIITSGTVSLNAGLNDLLGVTISSGSLASRDILRYSGSVWENVSQDPMMPRPGVAYRVVVGQCWNPLLATPAYVDVYRESFFVAADGSNPTGDIELKSSGVAFAIGGGGFIVEDLTINNARYTLFNDNVRKQGGFKVVGGVLTLMRGNDVDDATDGYFVYCDYCDA